MANWIPDETRAKLNRQMLLLIEGETFPHISEKERANRVKTLIEYGADVNAREDLTKKTALILAAAERRPISKDEAPLLVDTLLSIPGVDINALDDTGNTALHVSLLSSKRAGNAHVFNRLLNAGAAIEVPNKYGETALHKAALYGYADAAGALISQGANIHAVSKQDKSPVQVCVHSVKHALDNTGNQQQEYETLKQHMGVLKVFAQELNNRYRHYPTHPGSEFMLGVRQLETIVSNKTQLFQDKGRHHFEQQLEMLDKLAAAIATHPEYPMQRVEADGYRLDINPDDVDRQEMSRRMKRSYVEREASDKVAAREPFLKESEIGHAQSVKQRRTTSGDKGRGA